MNKVALVTGSESGIGQSIAIHLGSNGIAVCVVEFAQPDGAAKTKQAIEQAGGKAIVVHADVRSETDVDRAFSLAEQALGPVSILVNDAGINGEHKPVADLSIDGWQEVLATNLTGPFLCSRRFLQPYKSGSLNGGRIINISSVHEEMPAKSVAAYCAAKGGVRMFMRCLALEAAEFGVTVNNIGPGTIMTAMTKELAENPDELKEHEKTIPLGRTGQPDDIGKVALFLASDGSAYMTGTTIFVDGGMLLNVGSGPPQEG